MWWWAQLPHIYMCHHSIGRRILSLKYKQLTGEKFSGFSMDLKVFFYLCYSGSLNWCRRLIKELWGCFWWPTSQAAWKYEEAIQKNVINCLVVTKVHCRKCFKVTFWLHQPKSSKWRLVDPFKISGQKAPLLKRKKQVRYYFHLISLACHILNNPNHLRNCLNLWVEA